MSEPVQYRPDRTVWNPAQVEAAIYEVANEIANGVTVCGELYRKFLDADRAYDLAFAQSYLRAPGTVNQRKYYAEVATTEQRADRDLADAEYRLADRRSWALRDKLSGLQSVNKSIMAQYGATGRGEGA